MRRRTIAIIIAVVLALAAAGLVVWYVSSVRHETAAVEPTQTVLVATADIPERTTGEAIIANSLVARQQVVMSSVAPGAVSSEESLRGMILTTPIARGQQLLESQLGLPEEQSLSYQIKQGMRAITLPVDIYAGVGGAIKRGDRVDVIATFEVDAFQQVLLPLGSVLSPVESQRIQMLTGIDLTQTMSPLSRMLLQQVEVLAIDPLVPVATDSGGTEVTESPVITLMVTPGDAEKLVFVQKFGSVWFTLVGTEDTTEVDTTGQALPNLLR